MPTAWTVEELRDRQARAVWLWANSHRVRGWFARLAITEIRHALRGRVWPKGGTD